jgi:hypothetical protein
MSTWAAGIGLAHLSGDKGSGVRCLRSENRNREVKSRCSLRITRGTAYGEMLGRVPA